MSFLFNHLDWKGEKPHCIGNRYAQGVSCGHFETLGQTQSTLAHHLANISQGWCDHPGEIPTSCIIACQTPICTAQTAWFSPRYMQCQFHCSQWVLPGNRKKQNLALMPRPTFHIPIHYQVIAPLNHWSFFSYCHQCLWSVLLNILLPTWGHNLPWVKNWFQLSPPHSRVYQVVFFQTWMPWIAL